MYRTLLIALTLVLALVTVVPAVSATDGPGEPECVQVYPWSQLCKGDVGAVVCYYVAGLPDELCGPIR